MNEATMSDVRDPENRSKKRCACGGHSFKARKRKRPWKQHQQALEHAKRSSSV